MAVRSRLPWPWRVVAGLVVLAVVTGMWWWGYDFGQIFSGLDRSEIRDRMAMLESGNDALRNENAQLRARNMQLESELVITAGAQAALSKQAIELQNENSQIKEELAFLQKLVADSNKQVGLSIQRLAVERVRDDRFRYSMLVVRGGNPAAEFAGKLGLQVTLQPPAAADGGNGRPVVLSLPEDQPDLGAPLKLNFKYDQRVEGSFRVSPGAELRSLTARAFEDGQANPRATRSLNFP